jgi:hypothetical protein
MNPSANLLIATCLGIFKSPLSNNIGISSVNPSTTSLPSSFTGINLNGIFTLSPSSNTSTLYLSIKSFTLNDCVPLIANCTKSVELPTNNFT